MRILAAIVLIAPSLAAAQGSDVIFRDGFEGGAPIVLYTDIVSGPNSGGENGKGAYLSVFGRNFGTSGLGTTLQVFVGGVEVDNYRYLGPSKGRTDIEQITVQIGALGNPTPGVPLPITVVANGTPSNADHTFIVNPGHMIFVDPVNGDDDTAEVDDIAHPFRRIQTGADFSGVRWSSARSACRRSCRVCLSRPRVSRMARMFCSTVSPRKIDGS